MFAGLGAERVLASPPPCHSPRVGNHVAFEANRFQSITNNAIVAGIGERADACLIILVAERQRDRPKD
jgi:hypothetical protein